MADTKVGGVYIEIQARMGKLESDLKQVETRMRGVDNSGAKLSSTISTLGKYLAGGAIAYGILNIGKASLSAAAQMEQQKVAFTTMLGSAEKAKVLLSEMQAFAESTPFQFDEIVTAGKQMIAFGFEAGTVIDNLRMLGDVAAGLSQPVGDMVYLFGQIKTQGRAMTQDLMQFANRGVPIYDELAKVLGVDVSQVKEFASQGKIGFNEIEQVFKNLTQEGGKFAGLMDAQSQTLAGKWSNFNDQIDKTLLLLGDRMAPAAGEAVTMFSLLAKRINDSLEESNRLAAANPSAGFKSGFAQINAGLDGTIDKLQAMRKLNAEMNSDIELIMAGWGDASGSVDEMNAKYGELQTAANLLFYYNMGYITLNKDQISQMEEIVRLEQERLDKANPYIRAQKEMLKLAEQAKKLEEDAKKAEEDKKARAAAAAAAYRALKTDAVAYYTAIGDLEKASSTSIEIEQKKQLDNAKLMYRRKLITKTEYEESIKQIELNYAKQIADAQEKIRQDALAKEVAATYEKFDKFQAAYEKYAGFVTGISGQISELVSMAASNQTTRIEQEAQKRTDALNTEYEEQLALIEASAASDSQKAEQKKALDEQLARDTKAISDKAEKDKRKAQRESAKISKTLATFDTLINTPAAALQSFRAIVMPNMPWTLPLGIAAAAATTALGLAKLKLIQDQPLPALAEGGIVPAIPGGRQITVAEGGNSEGVIPFNERGVDILAQAMEKAISKIGGGSGATNVYIDSELIYSNMYEASRRGAVKIDQRAIV